MQASEYEQYEYKVDYLVVDNDIGIAKTRKEIVYNAEYSRFWMVDDDMVFYRRNAKYFGEEPNMDISKRQMTSEDFDDMFADFDKWMDEDNVVMVGHRYYGFPPSAKYEDFKILPGARYINGAEIKKFRDEIEWDLCQVGEDSMFQMECCLHGYIPRRSDEFCANFDQFQEGGCAEYRDSKFHYDEHMKLLKKWPGYVFQKGVSEEKHIGEIQNFYYKWKDAYDSYYKSNLSEFF